LETSYSTTEFSGGIFAEFNIEGGTLTLMQALYFTITTMSTVGYGDHTPQTYFGRWIMIALRIFSSAAREPNEKKP
jgi:hypothetical protein